MTTELYILLKVKGEYIHTRKERWIFSRLRKLDEIQEYREICRCKRENLIEPRGRTHTDDGWQIQFHKRDLFLTPYGEKRLNLLVDEYMNDWRNKILPSIKIVVELIAAIVGILSILLGCLKSD